MNFLKKVSPGIWEAYGFLNNSLVLDTLWVKQKSNSYVCLLLDTQDRVLKLKQEFICLKAAKAKALQIFESSVRNEPLDLDCFWELKMDSDMISLIVQELSTFDTNSFLERQLPTLQGSAIERIQ